MGFFDKLFNSGTNAPDPERLMGMIYDDSTLINVNMHEIFRDPSKAIDAHHWDGLTSEAQEALSKQGFYRKGDEKNYVHIKLE